MRVPSFNINFKLVLILILLATLVLSHLLLWKEAEKSKGEMEERKEEIEKNKSSIQGVINYINIQITSGVLPPPPKPPAPPEEGT